MRITEGQLRGIIRQEVKALREMASVGADEQVVLDFLMADDADGAADAIMDMITDPRDAGSTLESFYEVASEAGVRLPRGVIERTHTKLGKRLVDFDRDAMAASPDAPALQAIAASMGMSTISPADVRYMTFQPRRTGGAIRSVNVTFKDPDSGVSYANVLERDVNEAGITFEDFMASVKRLGAKAVARGPASKRSMPYYD